MGRNGILGVWRKQGTVALMREGFIGNPRIILKSGL